MIAQTFRRNCIQSNRVQPNLIEIRDKVTRIRQSWSPEERRQRLIRGQQKRAEICNLLTGRKDFRPWAR